MMADKDLVASHEAVMLRKELGISLEDAVEFPSVLELLNIRFKQVALPENILGACKVKGLKKLIVVSSKINNKERERFTIAHEIGHVILHHGNTACMKSDIGDFYPNTHVVKESQANSFAAAFLLPPRIVNECARDNEVSVNMAGKLSKRYRISLTAATIALVKASPYSTCLFVQSGGKIQYSVASENCLLTPRKGPVAVGTGICALDCNHPRYNANCDVDNWFIDKRDTNYLCTEESILLKGPGYAISIVHLWEANETPCIF